MSKFHALTFLVALLALVEWSRPECDEDEDDGDTTEPEWFKAWRASGSPV